MPMWRVRNEFGRAAVSIAADYCSVLLFLCSVIFSACATAPGSVTSETRVRVAAQIAEALASSEETWPAAHDRLVCVAPDVLAVLNSRPIPEAERPRVLEVISLSLLHKMSHETFRTRYRALNTIVAPEIERRRELTPIFTRLDTLHVGSFVGGCAGDECRRDALGTAEKVFEKLPGLSIPVLQDLARHPKPAVRLYAMIRMLDLDSSLAAMETSELLRNDTAEVWVARDDLDDRAVPINSYTAMTSRRASLYAQWNSAAVRGEAGTEESATERSMIAALGRAVALQACNWSEAERVVAVDAGDRQFE
jgi:hypothetical protein